MAWQIEDRLGVSGREYRIHRYEGVIRSLTFQSRLKAMDGFIQPFLWFFLEDFLQLEFTSTKAPTIPELNAPLKAPGAWYWLSEVFIFEPDEI